MPTAVKVIRKNESKLREQSISMIQGSILKKKKYIVLYVGGVLDQKLSKLLQCIPATRIPFRPDIGLVDISASETVFQLHPPSKDYY